MARVSEVREETLKRGYEWTADRYQYAVDKGAEKDEDFAPPKKAKAQAPDAAPPVDASNWGGGTMSLLGPVAAQATRNYNSGFTAGLSDIVSPPQTYDTGTGFGNFVANRVVPPVANAAGMMMGLGKIKAPIAGLRLAADAGIGAQIANRAIPLVQKLGIYEGIKGAGPVAADALDGPQLSDLVTGRENPNLADVLAAFAKSGMRGGVMGLPLAFLPPGGTALQRAGTDFGLGYGISTMEGQGPVDALLAGAGFAAGSRIAHGGGTTPPTSSRGKTADVLAQQLAEAKAWAEGEGARHPAEVELEQFRARNQVLGGQRMPVQVPPDKGFARSPQGMEMGATSEQELPTQLRGDAGTAISEPTRRSVEPGLAPVPPSDRPPMWSGGPESNRNAGTSLYTGLDALRPAFKGIEGIDFGRGGGKPRPAKGAENPSEKDTPVAAIPNNPVDAAGIKYKQTRNPQDWVEGIPAKPEAAPEVWQGILRGDRVSPPKKPTFPVDTEATPNGEIPAAMGGGRLVEETGTGKRFYISPEGEHLKPIRDVFHGEEVMSPTGQLMAGIGGGRLPGPKGSENPAVSHIKMPAEQAELNAEARAKDQANKAIKIFEDAGISDKDAKSMRRVGDLWTKLNNTTDLTADPREILLRPGVAESLNGSADPLKTIVAAQKTKRLMMDDFEFVNAVRAKMGEQPIGVQEFYRPKLRKKNWFEHEFGLGNSGDQRSMGIQGEEGGLPKWARPGVANPREMSRKPGLEYPEETRADVLLANYFHHMANSAFMRPTIAQVREVANVYRALGYKGSSTAIDRYATQALAGGENAFSEIIPKNVKGPLRRLSELQSKAVLGSINFAITQASGQAVQVGRHGMTSIPMAAKDLIFDRANTKWMRDNVPELQHKLEPHGGVSRQDLSEFQSALRDQSAWHEWLMTNVESALSFEAAASANRVGIKKGLAPRSRELAEFISNEVKNIQGGYGRTQRAGAAREPEFGIFAGKFQGYALQMFSQVRSLVAPGTSFGRTGYYRSEYANTPGGDAGVAKRALIGVRFAIGMAVANMLTGQKKWKPGSVVPWSSQMGIDGKNFGGRYMLPKEFWDDASGSVRDLALRGNGKKLRSFVLRWRVPLGIQADQTIDGYNAWREGGHYVTDKNGKRKKLFSVEDDELFTVLMLGPYNSREGRRRTAGDKKNDGEDSSARPTRRAIPKR
jgi:hypothetical protein